MLADFCRGRRVAVLTGAGCSTESGIPDYRGTGRSRRTIEYRAFVRDAAARRRYWARSVQGWPRFCAARPNLGHLALARLEDAGVVIGVITQNVDGLHAAAGSRRVVELHGSLAEVVCLGCGALEPRRRLQERLLELNPACATPVAAVAAPDGDAELPDDPGFRVAGCARCGGVLKPHVVMFGENVPRAAVDAAWGMLRDADALLVVGSSLAVFSGFRFVRGAAERALPIAIVNDGATRGDALATLRNHGRAGAVLSELADAVA